MQDSLYILEQSVEQRGNEGYMYLYSVEELSELYICHIKLYLAPVREFQSSIFNFDDVILAFTAT